jgi:hypothetical protein
LQQLIWKRDHWQFRDLSGLFFPRHFCEFLRRVRPPLFSTGAALIEQPTSTAHRELFVLLPLPPAESASALLCAVANPAPPRLPEYSGGTGYRRFGAVGNTLT